MKECTFLLTHVDNSRWGEMKSWFLEAQGWEESWEVPKGNIMNAKRQRVAATLLGLPLTKRLHYCHHLSPLALQWSLGWTQWFDLCRKHLSLPFEALQHPEAADFEMLPQVEKFHLKSKSKLSSVPFQVAKDLNSLCNLCLLPSKLPTTEQKRQPRVQVSPIIITWQPPEVCENDVVVLETLTQSQAM